jgi:two-component system cell cycle response regulator DivK
MDTNKNISERRERERRLLLIVDGSISDSFYTSILLQRLEYDIYAAKTAEDALELMTLTTPSLVLTEMALQGMSGLELLKHLKRDPRTAAVPVLIHAYEKDPQSRESCQRAGCAGYLVKPADPNALYASVQSATEPSPRRVIRLKTRLGLVVEAEDAGRQSAENDTITYLSESGLFISTPDPLPPGTVLPIVFSLKQIKIHIEGVVLYSFNQKSRPFGEYGMGMKFLRISAKDKILIRTFIMEQLTKNIAPRGKNSPPL